MHFFETSEARIAYDVNTPSETPSSLLVLLNGFQRPRQDFRALSRRIQNLNPSIATLLLDHRGSGSTQDGNLSEVTPNLELLAEEASLVSEHVARQLRLPKYSVLGISMGGMVAQCMALAGAPLNKLILVSTSPHSIDRLSHDIALPEYFGRAFSASHTTMVDAFVKSVQNSSSTESAIVRAVWQRAAIQKFDCTAHLNKIVTPTLIISGDDDAVIPCSCSVELNRGISESTLVIYPGVGHIILVEAPERLSTDVAAFLNS